MTNRPILAKIEFMDIIPALAHWLVSGAAILLVAKVAPGFRVRDYKAALIASVLIGLANAFLRPLLVFLTFPFTVLTLGLFLFVVDAMVLKLCARLMDGFEFDGWTAAIVTAVLLTFANSGLHYMFV